MIEFDNTALVVTAKMSHAGLPGRPMLDVNGRPLVLRALEQAERANLGKVFVAAAENRVAETVRDSGGDALVSGLNLTADADQAFSIINLRDADKAFVQVLVLPCHLAMIETLSLRRCLAGLMNKDVDVATLATPMPAIKQGHVEVIAPLDGDREVAYAREFKPIINGAGLQHIPIYAWRRAALDKFATTRSSNGNEMGRALEAGLKVAVVKVDLSPISVDTPEDLEALRRQMKA